MNKVSTCDRHQASATKLWHIWVTVLCLYRVVAMYQVWRLGLTIITNYSTHHTGHSGHSGEQIYIAVGRRRDKLGLSSQYLWWCGHQLPRLQAIACIISEQYSSTNKHNRKKVTQCSPVKVRKFQMSGNTNFELLIKYFQVPPKAVTDLLTRSVPRSGQEQESHYDCQWWCWLRTGGTLVTTVTAVRCNVVIYKQCTWVMTLSAPTLLIVLEHCWAEGEDWRGHKVCNILLHPL